MRNTRRLVIFFTLSFLFFSCGVSRVASQESSSPREAADLSTRLLPPASIETGKPDNALLEALYGAYPAGFYIINAMNTFPSKVTIGSSVYSFPEGATYRTYCGNSDFFDQVNRLEVAVHEINHGFTSRYAFLMLRDIGSKDRAKTSYSFCLDEHDVRLVSFGNTFPAGELKDFIPDTMRTVRFKTYIYPSQEYQSTQARGIYGLLDEYNSYYHGMRTAADLFDVYKNSFTQDRKTWNEYVMNIQGIYIAPAEFRYWILSYLIYARENHPDVYKEVLANEGFRYVFNTIDEKYIKLFSRIEQRMEDVTEHLDTLGFDVYGDIYNFNIGGLGSKADPFNYSAKLANAMDQPEYLEMAALLKR